MNDRKLTEAYHRFVPHQMLTYMNKGSIGELRLDDYVRLDMTVLFSDIRSFTSLSERLTPEETLRFLNSYLSRMEPSIETFGGFIDKFIGDSIMALFGTTADDAVRASLHMLACLRDYNLGRLRAGYEPIRVGIGLNSGPLLLGVVGGESRLQGTVIGDAVNVASRIEGLNKSYGTSLLLTGNTVERLARANEYAMRHIDTVRVRGRQRSERIYELYQADAPEIYEKKAQTQEMFEQARALFESGDYQEAKALFRSVYERNRFDLVSWKYIARCDRPADEAGAHEPAAAADIGHALERSAKRLAGWLHPYEDDAGAPAEAQGAGAPPALLARMAEAARIYFEHHLGFPAADAPFAPIWEPAAPLLDVTACAFLEGALDGGLLLSVDVDGALRLLHRMSYGGWSAEEEMPLMLDALGEALNIVAGNSLRMFHNYVDFVTIEPPVAMRTLRRAARPPAGMWSCTFPLGGGAIKLLAAIES
ncbi:adenylate/guanylate cyclase domain-containing protein [Paenibacillus sp.]|uniref:adenylate/guanylate cyclase domain-containing protein n=1 Tax=Paenibacillus sp. TaxID=58172 RepID=UPI002D2BF09D|nr:adenylate/guanylate cyclase domain-containing protein [Paenibacillus sp.]HZG87681.1 adenylate/guanylate cyclase domain-containing protein [Paenibacillus sp.]